MVARRLAFATLALLGLAFPAAAQNEPIPSRCIAIARAVPQATFVSFAGGVTVERPVLRTQAQVGEEVEITYSGHSTYTIVTPAGVRIATDFSGVYGSNPLPRVVTMNKAHRTHYTDAPDPAIEHVLPGWNPEGGGAISHAVVVDDVYIRNVSTDIMRWGQMEEGANSIFIFEVAGLCIGHLGHLHHSLTDAHYGAIGRLDIVMVPVDGGMTQSLGNMSEITERLYSSIVLPMHRHSTPLAEFTSRMGEQYDIDMRDSATFTVSLKTLPRRPTIVVLRGV
jgi:L-ascorbate metabolism protein UlaG (beta-lactamase superfamily)